MGVLGSLISQATIIPLGFDEGSGMDKDSLDAACQAVPWLYCLGFSITFSALFSKTYRVLKIFKGKSLKKQKIKEVEFMKFIGLAVFLEVLICTIWTLTDPLEWERTVTHTDRYGLPTESEGHCTSDSPWTFMGVIVAAHVFVLLWAVYLCYQTKDIPTDFQEGKWINMALVSNLQICILGVPVLAMVADNPTPSFFIRVGIIFLNDTGALLLMFGPKFYAVHFAHERKAISTSSTTMATTANGGNTMQTTSGRTTGEETKTDEPETPSAVAVPAIASETPVIELSGKVKPDDKPDGVTMC